MILIFWWHHKFFHHRQPQCPHSPPQRLLFVQYQTSTKVNGVFMPWINYFMKMRLNIIKERFWLVKRCDIWHLVRSSFRKFWLCERQFYTICRTLLLWIALSFHQTSHLKWRNLVLYYCWIKHRSLFSEIASYIRNVNHICKWSKPRILSISGLHFESLHVKKVFISKARGIVDILKEKCSIEHGLYKLVRSQEYFRIQLHQIALHGCGNNFEPFDTLTNLI